MTPRSEMAFRLYRPILAKDLPGLRTLLATAGATVEDLSSALGDALLQNAVVAADLLLRAGADVRRIPDQNVFGYTLHRGYTAVVHLMLLHGADPNQLLPGTWQELGAPLFRDYSTALQVRLHAGADPNQPFPGIWREPGDPLFRAIHLAVHVDRAWAIDQLAAAGADLEAPLSTARGGARPLHLAARHGRIHALEALLAGGADPNAVDGLGQTPLIVLIRHFHEPGGARHLVRAMLSLLLDFGADLGLADHSGIDALGHGARIAASTFGPFASPAFVQLLQEHPGKRTQPRIDERRRAALAAGDAAVTQAYLRSAALEGDIGGVRAALDAGADLNIRPPGKNSNYPLRLALFSRKNDLVTYMLDRGADVARVTGGEPFLFYLARANRPDLVQLLLERGTDPATFWDGCGGKFPLHNAAESGQLESLRLLLERGAAPNVTQPNTEVLRLLNSPLWKQPLHLAVDHLRVRTVDSLLRAGADPNARDGLMRVPLSYLPDDRGAEGMPAMGYPPAIVTGARRIALLLLEAGARPDLVVWTRLRRNPRYTPWPQRDWLKELCDTYERENP